MWKNKSNIYLALISFTISVGIVGAGTWFLSNNSQNIPIIKDITNSKNEEKINKPNKETILLLGNGGEEQEEGGDLTDTIMIAQILNQDKKIHLISIPRDFLVFDEQGYYSKINSVYIRALNSGKSQAEAVAVLQDKITEITGISFDYYAAIDFKGFVNLVNKLGGIEVDVVESIDDPYYPGPNYSYNRFILPAGIQTLDGETALKYARTRYTSVGGDIDRARRQQQIISNVKDRVFSLNPIIDAPKIISIFGIAKDSLQTDFSLTDAKKLYDTYKDSKDYTIKSLVIGKNLLTGNIKEGYRQFGSARGYILEPRIGEKNYLEIQEEISNIDDIATYEDKIYNLSKQTTPLDIILGANLTNTDKTHIKALLEARGFVLKIINSSQLDAIPDSNTLYLGNNPYNQSETDNIDISQDYLKTIFKPSIDTEQILTKDIPMLYIANTLKF